MTNQRFVVGDGQGYSILKLGDLPSSTPRIPLQTSSSDDSAETVWELSQTEK
jgi:hypothetical protein